MKIAIRPNRVKKMVKTKKLEGGYASVNPDGHLEIDDRNIFSRRVEEKAYELFEKRGRQDGQDLDDWFKAEKIVEEEMIAGN